MRRLAAALLELVYILGNVYVLTQKPGRARESFEYDPSNKSAHYLLGQHLQQSDRSEEAKRELAITEKLQAEPERR